MKKCFFSLLIIIIIIILYSIYIEPFNYKINEYNINVKDTSNHYNNLKIAHFTDTMINNKTEFFLLNKIAEEINNVNPNIIIFTGNLLSSNINDKTKKKINIFLSLIKVDVPKYAILDKYDNELSKELLLNNGYQILNKNSLYFFYKDINPILIENFDTIDNLTLPEENLNYNMIFLLLNNADDFDNITNHDIPIIAFAGNLGGEIRIPFYEGLIRNDGNKDYINNYYSNKNNQLYVSFGIGTSKRKIRLFNKPSFNLYRIRVK
ncbi:MAG: metallophosphoesterase [Mollicutes bacterium]|nr:metallophosphoesterase [Mollicutes bacterium]